MIDRLLDDDGSLEVHFQPVMAFDTGQIVGAEALLRTSLDGLTIPPPMVVSDAVANDRTRDLGRHVLDLSCRHAITWQRDDHPPVRVMVNLDATELLDEHLHLDIIDTLLRYGLDPELLTIEITESALISDTTTAHTNLSELRRAGIEVALDDFGTGFASLSHLRTVPMSTVKLDQTFVAGAADTGFDHEIVRSVIHLAHAVGLRTIAEGVETEAQWTALHGLGCDEWQGFLRAPALDPEAFERELSDQREGNRSVLARAADVEKVTDLDSFVLRRISANKWAHLGGAGRGAGWAGILDIDEAETPALSLALEEGVTRISHDTERWLFGAYHTRDATLVRLDADSVVVFGAPRDHRLPTRDDRQWKAQARDESAAVTSVSAAKRLADELELSEALQTLVSKPATTLDEAMRHVVDCVASSLSCEFGAIYLPGHQRVAFSDGAVAPLRDEALFSALDALAESTTNPRCHQDAMTEPLPIPVPGLHGIRSWMAIPIAPQLGGLIVCAHTERQPRGFTTLCQRLGARLADAAELILHAAIDRDRLFAEADQANTMAHRDALTGVMNRRGWNAAVELVDPSDMLTAVIVDANDLKIVNDRDGHAAGDDILVLISRCLQGLSRSTDTVARLGGDEFGVLLPGADSRAASKVEQKLLEVFELESLVHPGLSISYGFASRTVNESNNDVISRADSTMYEAKRAAQAERRTASDSTFGR